jgi:dynein heavy chain 2
MEYPSNEELVPVYGEFMKVILSQPHYAGGQMAKSANKLAEFLIDLYSNVRAKFSVDDHRHYLFTPRDITQITFNLLRYQINDAANLIETFIYESSRIFKDRLVDKESKNRFHKILYSILKNRLRYADELKDTYFISTICKD